MARKRRWALAVIGAAGTLALASLAFVRPSLVGGFHLEPRFDLSRWVADLPEHARWLVPFALLSASLPALRAIAWRHTLPCPASYADRYHAIALGGFIQNVIPGRLGALGSALFLGKRIDRPFASLLASFLIVKWLELAALVATASIAVLLPIEWAGRETVRKLVGGGVGICAVLAVALVLVARLTPAWVERLERRGRLLWLARALDSLADGLGAIGSASRLARAAATAVLPVAASGLAYGLALRATGAGPGVLGGWPLLAAITLAQVTPGLPIGTGVYYFVCAWGARELGVADAPAAALAVLTHAATGAVNLLVGAASALVHRRFFRELLAWRRARRASVPAA